MKKPSWLMWIKKIEWLPHMKYRLLLSFVLVLLGCIGAWVYSVNLSEFLRWVSGILWLLGASLCGYEFLRSIINDFTGKILK